MIQACRIWAQSLARLTVAWWVRLLSRPLAEPEPADLSLLEIQPCVAVAIPEVPVETLADQSVVHVVRRRRVVSGVKSPRWEFKRDILERLDEYFYCIRRMRKHDPDNYDLLSRTGLTIPAGCYINPDHHEVKGRIDTPARPSFGGVLITAGDDPDSMYPSFMYFSKLLNPSRVQLARGDVYALTVLFDNRRERNKQFILPVTCYVVIDAHGDMSLLRQAIPVTDTLYRKAGRRKERLELKQIQWRYPSWLGLMSDEHKSTAAEYAGWLLSLALETYTESHARTTIRVRHLTDTATFGIELSRCPRFFADRDATALAVDGKRKRIFHSVVQHARRLSDRSVEVKAHYRGLRSFEWNSYHVGIVWPTVDLTTFNAPASYAEDIEAKQEQMFVSQREAGAILANSLDQ